MTKWTADASDIQRWADEMKKFAPEFQTSVFDAIDKSVVDMKRTVKRAIPVGDKAPHLADTITIVDGNTTIHERSVTVGDDALYYAVPLEFGHVGPGGSHVPANPFFVPSSRVVNKRHKGRMKRAIGSVFKKFYPRP